MSIESIRAIRDCMVDLGINANDQITKTVTATLFNERTKASGTISVTFNSNWHSGDGPYLEIGDEIRSFGIQYEVFKPQFLDIKYNRENKKLNGILTTMELYGLNMLCPYQLDAFGGSAKIIRTTNGKHESEIDPLMDMAA